MVLGLMFVCLVFGVGLIIFGFTVVFVNYDCWVGVERFKVKPVEGLRNIGYMGFVGVLGVFSFWFFAGLLGELGVSGLGRVVLLFGCLVVVVYV